MQVFGKDSILHLGGVETADSREAWAADTSMEVRPSLFGIMTTLEQQHAFRHCSSSTHPVGGTDEPLLKTAYPETSPTHKVSSSTRLRLLSPSPFSPAATPALAAELEGWLLHTISTACTLPSLHAHYLHCMLGMLGQRPPGQETPAAEEFRDASVAEHDDIRGVRMGAGERSYLVRDRRIDVLRNVHGGVQARPPRLPARTWGPGCARERLGIGTCGGRLLFPAHVAFSEGVQVYLSDLLIVLCELRQRGAVSHLI